MASTRLTRTFGSTGDRQKWTWSAWVKRHELGSDEAFFSCYVHANDKFQAYFDSTDRVNVWFYNGTSYNIATARRLRDTNSWYHIVLRIDTTHGTANNRFRVYINGEEETDRETNNQPTQNLQMSVNQAQTHYISSDGNGNNNLNAALSHVHFLDGEDRDASYFGQTDSVTGEWSIKTSPTGINYGTNGFFILKDGNSLTDQSANSNNWAVNTGTLTKTEDNPSNVFCVYNNLQQTNGSTGFGNGLTYFTSSAQWLGVNGTLAATSGKYYAEFKVQSNAWGVGVADVDSDAGQTRYLSDSNNGYQSKYTGGKQIFLNGSTIIAQENNSTVINNAGMGNTSFANNDIVMAALDLDNNNLFFGKNGTWLRGATESEIEAGTSTNATFSGTSFNDKFWTWSVTTENTNMYANFGNGYFGTTAVSSAGTNASNNGIFEYDVPAGFTALSTKGLNL